MIPAEIVSEVQRLLVEGKHSQRRIARMTKVSRGTVGAIASGKRPDYASLRRTSREEIDEPTGPLQRCPGCGGMAYAPCRLCRTRAARSEKPRTPIGRRPVQPEEPLQLNLKEEHRLRYEEVRARREAQEAGTPGNAACNGNERVQGSRFQWKPPYEC